MTAKIIARVMLTLGFLAASMAYSSWTAQRTILDPSATRVAARALLDTPTVKTMLAKEIRTGLQPALGPNTDTKKLAAAIATAVDDPKFIAAYQDAIVSIQKSVFSDGNSRVTLDSAAVTGAITKALARVDPSTARKMQKVKAVNVPVGSSSLPHVDGAHSKVALVGRIALAIALALIGGALLLVHDRKMVRRASRRLAFLAFGPTLVFAIFPRVLDAMHKPSLEVGAAMLEAFGHRVLFSAVILACTGVSIWLITFAIPRHAADDPATTSATTSATPGAARPTGAPDVRIPSRAPGAPRPAREGLYL